MFARRFFISFPIFALIYLIQESVVSQFRIFGGGFSLFLVFTLLWSALGTPELGALTGFGAGLLMDLSQTTSGPMGQWTLIMILAGFAISYLGYGDDNFRGNPISLVVIVAIAVPITRLAYLVIGLMFGSELGSTLQVSISLLASALWTIAFVPLLMPFVTRIHSTLFEEKSRG
ncbi:MAG: rod shape-determining protein MreD [Actinomycetota bacterium]|jgi:rod shape-determining protein MreD|uniref:rod shape-determining protein MreD n=1 Tax=Candidatus Planktophila sp. TaxID=2175601 RepID=UPI002A09D017|nr:rod shape-determining protein MreD [Actinomycetota bacterium]